MLKLALCLSILLARASAQVTGQCSGNTDSAEDVVCGQDTHLIDPSDVAGTTVSECCENDTACVGEWSACDADCAKVYIVTSPATGAAAGCEAATDETATCSAGEGDCVAGDLTGRCSGNTDSAEDVECPSGLPLAAATDEGMLVSEVVELVAVDAGISAETCTGEIAMEHKHNMADTCERNFVTNGGTGGANCAESCTHAVRSNTEVVVAVRESIGLAASANPGELRENLAEICYARGLNPGWEYWTIDGTTEAQCCVPEACNSACRARARAQMAKDALQKCKNATAAENATAEEQAQAKVDCVAEELGVSAGVIAAIVVAGVLFVAFVFYCLVKRCCCNSKQEAEESSEEDEDEETGHSKHKKKHRNKADSDSDQGSEEEETGHSKHKKKHRSKADSDSDQGSEEEETGHSKHKKKHRSVVDSDSDQGSEEEETGHSKHKKKHRSVVESGSDSELENGEPPVPEPVQDIQSTSNSEDDKIATRSDSPVRERASSPDHSHREDNHNHHHHKDSHHHHHHHHHKDGHHEDPNP